MNLLKKSMSLALAAIMAVSCLVFSTTAYAADSANCTTVNFNGVENNSVISSLINLMNEKRAANSLAPITLDYSLTQYAKQRAKDLMVSYSADVLPNGDNADTYIPGYNSTCTSEIYYEYSGIDTAYLSSKIPYSSYSTNYTFQSVGIGVYTYDKYTTYYLLLSVLPAQAQYQEFNDVANTASVYTLKSNLSEQSIELEYVNNKLCYNIVPYAYTSNGACGTIKFNLGDFKLKSSAPSVMKIKGTRAYIKKAGKFTITATSKADPSIVLICTDTIKGVNKPKVSLTSVSSKSKKMTVKWKYTIKDATGYEIQYSTSKKFTKKTTKTAYAKGTKTTKKTISKLKKGKKYYVRVRAYVNQGNSEKYYGAFSKTKTVKIK